jgi:hypothetical protein
MEIPALRFSQSFFGRSQSITHIVHPQRSATFALPLCCIVIHSLLTGLEKIAFAALIVGVAPQMQVHAYVGLAVFSLALAVFMFPFDRRRERCVKCWALSGASALPTVCAGHAGT